MLPTTGFFKDIDCPFYENICDRPYCHFKHRKKNEEPIEISPVPSTTEVPTYNPTPKSQLATVRSHIPITYVPDLAVRSERSPLRSSMFGFARKQPIYNPTPISVLECNSKTNTIPASKISDAMETDVKENHGNVEEYTPVSKDICVEDVQMECNTIEEISINDVSKVNEIKRNKEKMVDKQKANSTCSTSKNYEHNGENKKKELKSIKSGDRRKDDHRKHSKSSKKKDKHDEKLRKKKESSKSRDSKHKSSSKDKSRSSKHHSSSKSYKERNKEKRSGKKEKEHKEKHKEKEKFQEPPVIHDNDAEMLSDTQESIEDSINMADFDSDHEEDELEECLKIFREYKPTEPQIFSNDLPKQQEDIDVLEISHGKKRIAHENAEKLRQSTVPLNKPKAILSAAQSMANRFKMARLQMTNRQSENSEDTIAEIRKQINQKPEPPISDSVQKPEVTFCNRIKKLVQTSLTFKAVPKPSSSSSLVDDILNGKTSSSSKPRRIAPVSNVLSIQRAKAKVEEITKMQAISAASKKTISQNIKGTKRMAHVPEVAVAEIPDVYESENSKLPVNVRSRFLTMILDGCLKLYFNKEDAQKRAQNEEYKCYERCSALATYKNSVMLAVNRIRKEYRERVASDLGPIMSGEECSTKQSTSELTGRRLYENVKAFALNEEELELHGFPRQGSARGFAIIKSLKKNQQPPTLGDDHRVCCRCFKHYRVDEDGFALFPEECQYHPLKKRTFRGESIFLCCKSSDDTGCVMSNTHVSETLIKTNSDIEGYQTTMPEEVENDSRSYQVYSLDCEMCYTTRGLELTRVTIVNSDGQTVYETFVKPFNPIIDYNTRFSGITKEQMERTATSILQVQANILHLCNSKTLLVGHSLESDMKALKIIHSNVIDTSVLFPHKFGLPHKRALRDLAREYLKKIIQNNISGHDSAEDALTCMELLKWKIKEDLKARGIKV